MTNSWLALLLSVVVNASDNVGPHYPSCHMAVGGCATVARKAADPARHTVSQPEPVADTVAMLEAIWKAADAQVNMADVQWFYLPSAATTGLTASDAVRRGLVARGIPASDRLPVGDDTLVVRMTQKTRASNGSLHVTVSTWRTYVIGSGERRCRKGSGNTFTIIANKGLLGWTAVNEGPFATGDSVCQRPAVDSTA